MTMSLSIDAGILTSPCAADERGRPQRSLPLTAFRLLLVCLLLRNVNSFPTQLSGLPTCSCPWITPLFHRENDICRSLRLCLGGKSVDTVHRWVFRFNP